MTICNVKVAACNYEPTGDFHPNLQLLSPQCFSIFQLIVLVFQLTTLLPPFILNALISTASSCSRQLFSAKIITHCTLPAQHQTADRHS